MSLPSELMDFLKNRKKLWLIPILVVIALLAVLVVVGGHPSLAPFIYTLF